MGSPKVSVVIPFYGDPGPTLALIADLGKQREAPRFEIIVSDDASPTPFPETEGIVVVRRAENGGFARAVNSGAAAAIGDYLLILNSDLEVHPAFLRDLWHAARPWMPALVTVPLRNTHGEISWTGRHFPTVRQSVVEWLVPLVRLREQPALHEAIGHDLSADGTHDEAVDWVVGALMYLPREAYEAVRGMDDSFYMNSEEVDLQQRLRELAMPSIVLGGHGVEHEGGGSSANHARVAWMLDGRRRYFRKTRGIAGLRIFEAAMLGATGVNLLWNLQRSLRGIEVDPWGTARTQYRQVLHPEEWVPKALRFQEGC